MFGTLIGYVFFFRLLQYLLFAFQTGMLTFPFLRTSENDEQKPSYQPVPTQDKKESGSALEVAGKDSNI